MTAAFRRRAQVMIASVLIAFSGAFSGALAAAPADREVRIAMQLEPPILDPTSSAAAPIGEPGLRQSLRRSAHAG